MQYTLKKVVIDKVGDQKSFVARLCGSLKRTDCDYTSSNALDSQPVGGVVVSNEQMQGGVSDIERLNYYRNDINALTANGSVEGVSSNTPPLSTTSTSPAAAASLSSMSLPVDGTSNLAKHQYH